MTNPEGSVTINVLCLFGHSNKADFKGFENKFIAAEALLAFIFIISPIWRFSFFFFFF